MLTLKFNINQNFYNVINMEPVDFTFTNENVFYKWNNK